MTIQDEFEEQARPHLDGLYRTAFRMAGERAAAEDLVQESFLKAFRAFGQFQKGSNFKAWIYTILTRTFINEYRRRSRAPIVTDFSEVEPAGVDELPVLTAEDVERLGDRLGDPARQALARVPEELRLVFLLSTFEDLNYREIAPALEIPIGTVMSRLFRARRILREELAAFAREEGYLKGRPAP